jgi:hypothetical protein
MEMKFMRDRAINNLLVAGGRSYLRKTNTAVREAVEDPRNGGGSS